VCCVSKQYHLLVDGLYVCVTVGRLVSVVGLAVASRPSFSHCSEWLTSVRVTRTSTVLISLVFHRHCCAQDSLYYRRIVCLYQAPSGNVLLWRIFFDHVQTVHEGIERHFHCIYQELCCFSRKNWIVNWLVTSESSAGLIDKDYIGWVLEYPLIAYYLIVCESIALWCALVKNVMSLDKRVGWTNGKCIGAY